MNRESAHCAGCINCWRASGRGVGTRKPRTITRNLVGKRLTGSSEGSSSRFVRGFLSASLLFCTGSMAVLGSICDGLRGDYLTLSIKSVLNGFISIAFASTLGIGVAFSALPVFAYQGSTSLLATQLNSIMSNSMMNEMTATGGILFIGIGISSLLEINIIRVGSFLLALVFAPLISY